MPAEYKTRFNTCAILYCKQSQYCHRHPPYHTICLSVCLSLFPSLFPSLPPSLSPLASLFHSPSHRFCLPVSISPSRSLSFPPLPLLFFLSLSFPLYLHFSSSPSSFLFFLPPPHILSVCVSLTVSVCLSVCLCFSLSFGLSVSHCLSFSLTVSVFLCLCLSACLSVSPLSLCLCLSACLSLPSMSLSVYLSVCLSPLSMSLSVCLSVLPFTPNPPRLSLCVSLSLQVYGNVADLANPSLVLPPGWQQIASERVGSATAKDDQVTVTLTVAALSFRSLFAEVGPLSLVVSSLRNKCLGPSSCRP